MTKRPVPAVNWVLYQIESLGQDPRQALPRMIKQAKKEAPNSPELLAVLKDAYKTTTNKLYHI